jgi:hypothetical protein
VIDVQQPLVRYGICARKGGAQAFTPGEVFLFQPPGRALRRIEKHRAWRAVSSGGGRVAQKNGTRGVLHLCLNSHPNGRNGKQHGGRQKIPGLGR